MNLFSVFQTHILNILEDLKKQHLLPADISLARVAIESPKDAAFGDMSTNAAMVLATPAGKKPRDLATLIITEILKLPDVTSADIAGPGFIWPRC